MTVAQMTLASHQPDLFPYSGFFFKMWLCDKFDVAVHDQFQKSGYQRRVLMNGSWASLPVVKAPTDTPINEIRLAKGAAKVLRDIVIGRYRHSPYWKERQEMVLGWIDAAPDVMLSEFNMYLILKVKDYLRIPAPLRTAHPPEGKKLDGILHLCQQYSATQYISGAGGRAYMGDDPHLAMREAGTELLWASHNAWTSESILTNIFHRAEPYWDVRDGTVLNGDSK